MWQRLNTFVKETTSVSRMSRHNTKTAGRDKSQMQFTQLRLENTYKLKPDAPFRVGKVKEKINQILESKLADFVYSPDKASNVALELSSSVKAAVKQLKIHRHKLVVLVNLFPISEDCKPSVTYASRCLWNTETDNSASVVYNTHTATIVVLVFGLYFD